MSHAATLTSPAVETATAPAAGRPASPGATPPAASDSTLRVRRLSRLYGLLIWLPLVAVALGAAGAWHFVYTSFASNPVLNGVILAVAIWGALAMFGHVRVAYREDGVFASGIAWLRQGAWSNEPAPRLGPGAYVLGMLERLEKLGLGHQVYVQSAAMEPELEALEHHLQKRQELSNFLVGLMVGLGLLGTFIGLLETLLATSELIGSIAASLGGSGGGIEQEFAKIIGGLQKPLAAMGTAFSASMFGLVGSIMLGFQAVIVNKTMARLIDHIREEVLSLAEKSKVNANVEITERYLATLMADMLEQHRLSQERLADVAQQIAELTPQVSQAAQSSVALAESVRGQHDALDRTTAAVGQVRDVVPLLGELAHGTAIGLNEASLTRDGVREITRHIPDQAAMNADLRTALAAMAELRDLVRQCHEANRELTVEVRHQGAALKRMDAVLWNAEKQSVRDAMHPEDPR